MVDLSKHLARIKQALDRRNYDLVFEVVDQCVDADPANIEVHRLFLDAAKRKAKEGGRAGFMSTMSIPSLTKDPQKLLAAAIKRVAKAYDTRALVDVGDAAARCVQNGAPKMAEVAILYLEDQRSTGMFSEKALWTLHQLYYDRYRLAKSTADIDNAIRCLKDLEKAMPNHPEASRTLKNLEAARSIAGRDKAGGDYRGQLANDANARRNDVMNRQVRTVEDAREVLKFIDEDLVANAGDKSLWAKKGDIHRRIGELGPARAALLKAQELDPHDFTVTMRLGDIALDEARARVRQLEAAGQDAGPAKKELIQAEITEFRKRIERQPTDLTHRYSLGLNLIKTGDIDGAAAEFQRTVADPKLKKGSHRYLGFCFAKKNLLDLSTQQYTAYLALAEDDLADEAKEVRYLRARVLEDQGKKAEAIQDYERLVNIDLNYKDAATRLQRIRG
jgi:tetratricopeptide (TPR) repeat protein